MNVFYYHREAATRISSPTASSTMSSPLVIQNKHWFYEVVTIPGLTEIPQALNMKGHQQVSPRF